MQFRTAYSNRPKINSSYDIEKLKRETEDNHIVSDIKIFKRTRDGDIETDLHHRGLVCTSRTNVHKLIQKSAEGTKVYEILDKMARGLIGDVSFNQGSFIDVSTMPKDIIEVYETARKAEKEFSDVPKEMKDLFGSNPFEFASNFNADKWNKYLTEKIQAELKKKEGEDNGK